ncbi:MAG: hypothetical protein M1831_002163 [Alyxoria varia]|nr:MAG: hypothetical protein M1831_002163 [Alyxoria varia]
MSISTRFLIISDTHHTEPSEFQERYHPLPKVDVVLHCGDLTQVGGISAYRKALSILKDIDAELKLVIAGNHDLELDGEYWRSHLLEEEGDRPEEHDEAVAFWKGPQAKDAHVEYLEEGIHEFQLSNGAHFKVYTSPYQPEFNDMAFNYKHDEDRFNASSSEQRTVPEHPVADHPGVDIMMTHGPPHNILDQCKNGNVGCPHLRRALERARPRMHCFGHIHEGYGAGTLRRTGSGSGELEQQDLSSRANLSTAIADDNFGDSTLVVNASTMTEGGQPTNKPVLAEISLFAGSAAHS